MNLIESNSDIIHLAVKSQSLPLGRSEVCQGWGCWWGLGNLGKISFIFIYIHECAYSEPIPKI